MSNPYFLCHKSQMWEDSWTYGDWRQYICNRPNGQTQCARVSGLFAYLMFFGFIFVALGGVTIAIFPPEIIAWERTILMIIGGATAWFVPLYLQRRGKRLMKAVGPYNLGATRVFPDEDRERVARQSKAFGFDEDHNVGNHGDRSIKHSYRAEGRNFVG